MTAFVRAIRPGIGAALLGLAALAACERPPADAPPSTGADRPADFVNRVWRVPDSEPVTAGQLYVFLSEGTLVIASPTGTPMVGTWARRDDGITMTEEGIAYPVDVLRSDRQELRLRSHHPGGVLEFRLVAAADSGGS